MDFFKEVIQEDVYPKVFKGMLSNTQIIAQMNQVSNTLRLQNSTQNNCLGLFSELLNSSNSNRVEEFRTLGFMGDFELIFGSKYNTKSHGLKNLGANGHCLDLWLKNLTCIENLQHAIANDSSAHFEQLMFDN